MAHGAQDYDAFDGGRPRRALALIGLGVAAASAVAIVAGLGLWGWRLSERDPMEVPVVRALDGPMKMRPEDPGGLKLEETDLSVTRMISGDRGDGEVAVAPGPEELADEDLPMTELRPTPPPAAGDGASVPDVGAVAGGPEAREAGAPEDAPPPAARIDELVAEALENEAVDPVDSTALAPRVAPLSVLRPTGPRPVAVAEAPQRELEDVELASGDIAIQLGAFNTPEVAEAQWRAHLKRNAALLGEFGHAVTPVQSGGRSLYRLRVGPMPSRERAQELCAALKGRGEPCIVARVR